MKRFKAALTVAAAVLSMFVYVYGSLVYVFQYRTSVVDRSVSDDHRYVVLLQNVGRRGSSGSARGRLVLGDRRHVIAEQDFTMSFDSRGICPDIWEVAWLYEGALIILNGAEQGGRSYLLGFDGTVRSERMHPEISKIPDGTEESGEPDDSDGGNPDGLSKEEQLMKEKYELVERELKAIAGYLRTEGALSKVQESDTVDLTVTCTLDAKGWPYAIVYQEETEFDGIRGRKVQTVTYDYMKEYDGQDEFVYEESYYDGEGNSVKDTQILDFFLVDHATLEVTDEHTAQWH